MMNEKRAYLECKIYVPCEAFKRAVLLTLHTKSKPGPDTLLSSAMCRDKSFFPARTLRLFLPMNGYVRYMLEF